MLLNSNPNLYCRYNAVFIPVTWDTSTGTGTVFLQTPIRPKKNKPESVRLFASLYGEDTPEANKTHNTM